MGVNTDRMQMLSAQRLQTQIDVCLAENLDCAQVVALLAFKSVDVANLCRRVMLNRSAFDGWLEGRVPILPSKQFAMLELVLGIEHGRLVNDRVHFFDINEKIFTKSKILENLNAIRSMFSGARTSIVCSEEGKDRWLGGSSIQVIEMPDHAPVILTHRQGSMFGSQPVSRWLDGVQWASHGTSHERDRSELTVSPELAIHLSRHLPAEGDPAGQQLIEQFRAMAKLESVSKGRTGIGATKKHRG